MIYIPCYDADRPESADELMLFVMTINGIQRTVQYDDDGAFIVKVKGKTFEHDITDEQWEQIEDEVNARLG